MREQWNIKLFKGFAILPTHPKPLHSRPEALVTTRPDPPLELNLRSAPLSDAQFASVVADNPELRQVWAA